jgi:putative flippase GtrA
VLRRREIAFLIVGGINTAVGLGAFALFEWHFGNAVPYLGNLVLAYAVGTAVAFTLHRRFVFRVRGNVLIDLTRFIGVQASALLLNAAILSALVELVRLQAVLAQALSLAIVVSASYFGHLMVSFRRPRG